MDLQNMLEESGFTTRGYSGRGMNGGVCLGVETSNPWELFAHLIDVCETVAECEYVADAMRAVRQDNMGRGYILYWTSVAYSATHPYPDEEVPTPAPVVRPEPGCGPTCNICFPNPPT